MEFFRLFCFKHCNTSWVGNYELRQAFLIRQVIILQWFLFISEYNGKLYQLSWLYKCCSSLLEYSSRDASSDVTCSDNHVFVPLLGNGNKEKQNVKSVWDKRVLKLLFSSCLWNLRDLECFIPGCCVVTAVWKEVIICKHLKREMIFITLNPTKDSSNLLRACQSKAQPFIWSDPTQSV